jgi:cysteine-rich repeat protein
MRTNKALVGLAISGLIAGGAWQVKAADIGVPPTKLIVVDKTIASGTAKAVFVAKDPNIDKGSGTDTATISGQLQMKYDNGVNAPITGAFQAPSGGNWLVNKTTVAKYVDKDAPTGGGTKVSVIKPGNLVKLVGKNTGDQPLDIVSQAGAPSGDAATAYTVNNGDTSNTFCSISTGCAWKAIAGGTGAKLVCKGGTADPACSGVTTRCVGGAPNDTVQPGEQCDDGNVNDGDGCTKACTVCGDGVVSAPEQCDAGGLTCSTGPRNGLSCTTSDYNRTCAGGTNAGAICLSDGDCPSSTCSANTGCGGGGTCAGGTNPGAICANSSNCTGGGVCSGALGFCVTHNTPGCDANCTLPTCGNGNVSGSETCDDGNNSDFDNCPADCIVDSCTNPGGDYTVQVNFAGSHNVAGITVFLDYPEGQVIIPGSGGDQAVSDSITDLPGFAFGQANDLDHALIEALADTAAFPAGQLFNVHFQSCNGATPAANQFNCIVQSAGDADLNPISGVTCSVSVP